MGTNKNATHTRRSHKEDNDICERQQIGVTSPLARPGPLARRENGVNAVDRWIVERILEEPSQVGVAAA